MSSRNEALLWYAAAWGVLAAGALLLLSCAAAVPTSYGVERERCVHDNGTPEAARECMRGIDQRYGQDGGLRHE